MSRIVWGLAAALLTATAVGAQSEADIGSAFAAVDANGDAVIDVDEFVAHYLAVANDLDLDDDRSLSLDEVPNVDAARFRSADRNGDGAISYPEVISERVYIFYESDTDDDGVLTLDEVLAAEGN